MKVQPELLSSTVLSAAVATTSGTGVDFTNIAPGAKKITVNFSGVSLSGTDHFLVAIGDSGGLEFSGYSSNSTGLDSAATSVNAGNGFVIRGNLAASVIHGSIELTLLDATTNTWCAKGVFARSDSTATIVSAGSKSLSDVLTQLRVLASGANTFDAGKVGILVEY